jgi:hypothetical protein
MTPLSTAAMLMLWSQGVADLAIVVVKPQADEDVATHLRRKLEERDRKLKAKGQTR